MDLPRRFFSRFYAKISERLEGEGLAALRSELLGELSGDVVEVGAGNGMNFRHYPDTVTHASAVEPEPHLRSLADRAHGTAPVPVTVRPGTADRLPLADDSVDAAVLCLVMCSLDDRATAFAELRRVLHPGGKLRFLEHIFAETPDLHRMQRLADTTFWPLLSGGCHTANNPIAEITEAGFEITTYQRLSFPEHRFSQPSTPHVLGTAHEPT